MLTRHVTSADGTRLCVDVYPVSAVAEGSKSRPAPAAATADSADAADKGAPEATPSPSVPEQDAEGAAAADKPGSPRGSVLILPGYADHRGRYGHVAAHL